MNLFYSSKEVQTETITIKVTPLANGFVKAKTGASTVPVAYNGWYSEMYIPETTFGVSEASLSIAQGESDTDEILNILGAVSVEIKKGTSPTTDVTAEINGSTITIYVDEEATTGSYTATLTDSGRTSGNTATIIITVTA